MKIVPAIFTVLSLSIGSLHAAPTCEQFKAAIVEGAAQYDAPAPEFRLQHVNSADANVTYWTIVTFGDVRAMMSCWHGRVGTFAADAIDHEMASSLDLLVMMGIGLHGYGLEWRPALYLRDNLVRAANASDPQTAEIPVDDESKASLVISFVGVPSFQIDTDAEVKK